MVDVSLVVTAVVIPFLLIFFNLIVMAHYIDPQAAGGHFIGKLMVVSVKTASGRSAAPPPALRAPLVASHVLCVCACRR